MRMWLALVACTALAQDAAALYRAQCSYCHGARGEGGRGPDLTTGRYKHGDLFTTIRNGVKGTEMPAVRASDDDVRRLAEYVKSLARVDSAAVSGDPAFGHALYEANCGACHETVGPDLAGVARRGAAFVRESILEPGKEIAMGYRAIRVMVKDGAAIEGIRLNEDDTSIQIRDTRGQLRSLLKAGIVEIDRSKPSLMPSFAGRLDDKQIDALIAFLRELR
ncbi:MAG: c-type cytochrome [Acidobacteria bacterium]|nr:c-type cytochrome [Acidobacteriota bacterium]